MRYIISNAQTIGDRIKIYKEIRVPSVSIGIYDKLLDIFNEYKSTGNMQLCINDLLCTQDYKKICIDTESILSCMVNEMINNVFNEYDLPNHDDYVEREIRKEQLGKLCNMIVSILDNVTIGTQDNNSRVYKVNGNTIANKVVIDQYINYFNNYIYDPSTINKFISALGKFVTDPDTKDSIIAYIIKSSVTTDDKVKLFHIFKNCLNNRIDIIEHIISNVKTIDKQIQFCVDRINDHTISLEDIKRIDNRLSWHGIKNRLAWHVQQKMNEKLSIKTLIGNIFGQSISKQSNNTDDENDSINKKNQCIIT